MGKVSGNWITGAHSGRACRHEKIYTKVNRRTGACYSVMLCNPNENWSEDQIKARVSFGAISAAISAWVDMNKEQATDDYIKVFTAFDRQHKYATLRTFMYAKGYYSVDASGKVTVNVNANANAGAGGSGTSGNGELG